MNEIPPAACREEMLLAPYAFRSRDSQGRVYPEPPHPYRCPFVRDRDRIVHSSAFRRLAHKTQVFTGDAGDYHRTRLTHTLEVASIARTLARALQLNEDLAEALALAHDIGHPPFGHAGEDVLNQCAAPIGGFNHNLQAVRIVELLEKRYPEFPGLNLSREILQGQSQRASKGADKEAGSHGGLLEVQVVDAADSIAYDSHDADDALEVGLIELAQLREIPIWREAVAEVNQRYGEISPLQLRRAAVRQLIDTQVSDLLEVTRQRIKDAGIASPPDVVARDLRVQPSPALAKKKRELESFLFRHVYRHPQVLASRSKAQAMLAELFDVLRRGAEELPHRFRELIATEGFDRAVVDYIASMTDRYAWDEFSRLTGRG